jgi:hypothetical protein
MLSRSNYKCLVINLSSHTYILFIFDSFPYNVMYPPWLIASYHYTSFTFLVWTYLVPLIIWVSICFSVRVGVSTLQPTILFEIPSQLLFWKVEHKYRDKFPTFSPTMIIMNWYSYHQKQLSNLNGCCHNWFDPPKYGIMHIVHNCKCNDNCHSKKNMIIHGTHIRRQLHSPCHIILWLFSLIIFYLLFSSHYNTLLVVLFSSCNGYFLLLLMCVHNPLVCGAIAIFQCSIMLGKHSSSYHKFTSQT